MASHNTAGPLPRPRLVWVIASAAAAAGWAVLVAAAPPRFFAVAVAFCALWAVLSAAGAPRRSEPDFAPLDLAVGVASGALLHLASRAFLHLTCGPYTRALCGPLGEMFDRIDTRGVGAALALGFVIAPAEELFWRGVVQAHLAPRLGAVRAVAVATLAAAAASLATGEPLLALVTVPTWACWGALFAWRKDLTAPIASHATWVILTASLFPPVQAV